MRTLILLMQVKKEEDDEKPKKVKKEAKVEYVYEWWKEEEPLPGDHRAPGPLLHGPCFRTISLCREKVWARFAFKFQSKSLSCLNAKAGHFKWSFL